MLCYIVGMNATCIGEDWNCPTCGRHMTPHGDCIRCDKIERARAEAAGERKRAKNIVVGDIIRPCVMSKIGNIEVKTVEITPKGKVFVNKGMSYLNGEDTFQSEQWVDMAVDKQSKCATLTV